MHYAPTETLTDLSSTMPPEMWLEQYAASEYGQYHAQQPLRYSRWSYDREQMLAELGPDVHPLEHMAVAERTLRGLRQFDASDRWSPSESYISSVQALTHELGECAHPALIEICGKVVGDIPYGQKTDEDRRAEAKVWRTMFTTHYPEAPDYLADRLEALVTHQEDSYTHHALEVAHSTGFLRTGLRAGRVALRERAAGTAASERLEKLGRMAVTVTSTVAPKIQQYTADFAYVDAVWAKAEPLYTRIQEELA